MIQPGFEPVSIDYQSDALTILFLKRLSDELEAMKDKTMERVCQGLTDELRKFHQIHLKNELQKQKQKQQGTTQPKAHQVQIHIRRVHIVPGCSEVWILYPGNQSSWRKRIIIIIIS